MRKQAMILMILIMVSACGSSHQEASQQPIKIGVLATLTGFGATWGHHYRQGAELAQQEINAQGGINGHPIQLLFEDIGAVEPKKISTATEKFVEIDGVDLLFTQWAEDTEIAYPITQRKDLVIINIASGSPNVPKKGPNVLMIAPSDEEYVKRMIDYVESQNSTKGAVILQASAYYDAIAEIFSTEWDKRGHLPLDIHRYQYEEDFKTILLKAKRNNPDFVWLNQDYDKAGLAKKQAKELGIDVIFLGLNENDVPEFFNAAGSAADGVIYTEYERGDPAWAQKYKDTYGEEVQIPADYAYDAIYLLKRALEGKEVSTHNIREGILAVQNYSGASGMISFDAEGQRSGKRSNLMMTKDGKGVPVQ